MCCIGLHYCSKFKKNLTKFRRVMAKKPPKAPKNGIFCCLENI